MTSDYENTCSPLVELENVGKRYHGIKVLDGISLRIEAGSAKAIIGPNGSGKSTLLAVLAGLIQPSSGRLIREDKRTKIGYAPEIFPPLKFTPEEFLRSVGRMHGLSLLELEPRISELLECFSLESYRTRSMEGFSKGMLQKVNLMQSILMQPSLLLLDEPMSGLDAPSQDSLLEYVLGMKRKGTAIVFSTHEPHWLEVLADDVLVLMGGQTIRTINRIELRSSDCSTIVCTGLSEHVRKQLSHEPEFILTTRTQESQNNDAWEITVQATASDAFLRKILEAGGSVLSVERSGGITGLETWMSPKDNSQKVAKS